MPESVVMLLIYMCCSSLCVSTSFKTINIFVSLECTFCCACLERVQWTLHTFAILHLQIHLFGIFFFFHLRVGPVLIILYIVHGADRNASVSRSSISRFSQGIKNDSISLWVVQSDMGEKCIMISVFHISRSLSLSLALSSIILYMYTVFLYSQQKVSDNKAN